MVGPETDNTGKRQEGLKRKPPGVREVLYTTRRLFYFFAAGAAAAAFAGAAPALASSVSAWRRARVVTTEAIGIRGELSISMLSALTSSTRTLPPISRLSIFTEIFSARYLGRVRTLSVFA